jgi:hypothetical protein
VSGAARDFAFVPILLQKSGIVVARLLRRFAEAVFSHPAL